jgi:hypothetical protein
MPRAFLILAMLLPAAGCASAQAKAPVEPVALEVPAVPPRVIEPVTIAAPQPVPVDTTVAPAPAPAAPKPRPSASGNAQRPESKPDTVKPDSSVEQDIPPPAPVPPLRTGGQSSGPEVARQIRESLARNRTLLGGFDARTWSEDRKAALESAKDSIDRAYEALQAGNVVLAKSLADRAETLAKLLLGR